MTHRRQKGLCKRLLAHALSVTMLCSVLCGVLLQYDIKNVYGGQYGGQTSSTDVLNVILTTGGSSAAVMGGLSEGRYTATNNTIGNQRGQIKLDNTNGGYMHVNIGQALDMYAPSADVDYTDNIGYSGNYTFLAAGGKGGSIDAIDKWHGQAAKADGGYGTAVTSNSIDYSTGQSITYRKGSNGASYGRDVAQNSQKWDWTYQYAGMIPLNPMGSLDGRLYGQAVDYTAYTVSAQVGTASYIQTGGSNYIVAGGGAPGAVLFEDFSYKAATATGSNGCHADVTPSLPSGYLFYNPGADNMARRYRDFAECPNIKRGNINTGRIPGMAVKNGCKQHPDWGGGTYYEDMFYVWRYKTQSPNKISSVYPGYSGSATRKGSVFTPNSNVTVGLNTSARVSAPYCKIKCNAKYITINHPSREGYTFNGWSCGSGVSVVSKTGSQTKFKVTGSGATITANWKAVSTTVTFHRNTSTSDSVTAAQTFTYEVPNQRFTDKGWTRTGYTQLGWSHDRAASKETYSIECGITNKWIANNAPSCNLYAVWRAHTYTIEYNASNE